MYNINRNKTFIHKGLADLLQKCRGTSNGIEDVVVDIQLKNSKTVK